MKAVGLRIIHPYGWVEFEGNVEAQQKRYLTSLKRQYGKDVDYELEEFEYEAKDSEAPQKVEGDHA